MFSGRIIKPLNVQDTSRLKLILFKFHEICVFYRKVIKLYVRCKKMQHFQNNVANNVVINLTARI